jgi:hypothetical protein
LTLKSAFDHGGKSLVTLAGRDRQCRASTAASTSAARVSGQTPIQFISQNSATASALVVKYVVVDAAKANGGDLVHDVPMTSAKSGEVCKDAVRTLTQAFLRLESMTCCRKVSTVGIWMTGSQGVAAALRCFRCEEAGEERKHRMTLDQFFSTSSSGKRSFSECRCPVAEGIVYIDAASVEILN